MHSLYHYRQEVSFVQKSSIISAINLSFFLTTLPTIMFITFSVYAGLGEEITKRKVFVTLSLLSIFNVYFNYAIAGLYLLPDVLVALKRIKVCFHLYFLYKKCMMVISLLLQRFLLIEDNMNNLCSQNEPNQLLSIGMIIPIL